MIRIKDNIFNEENIVQMFINEKHNLEIDTCNGFPIVIKDVKFDDIEWNYENNISESLSYDLAKAKIEELENKIKELEEKNKTFEDYNKDLNRIINSLTKHNADAVNYMLDNCIDEKTGRISNPDILKIFKFLSNGGEPVIKKGGEEID